MAAAMHGSLIRVGGGNHCMYGDPDPQLDAMVLHYLETGEVTMIAQVVVDTARRAVTCKVGHQAITASTAGLIVDIASSLSAMCCKSATPAEPVRRK
jgi:hypothetical protein